MPIRSCSAMSPTGIFSLVCNIIYVEYFKCWIFWNFGFTDWSQYFSLATSIFSLAWGTTNGLLLFLNGNRKVPELANIPGGLLCILPHTIMMTGGYSLLSAFGFNLSAIFFIFMFLAFFLLSAMFSNSFFSFVFSIFSSFFSPVLFSRHGHALKEQNREAEQSNSGNLGSTEMFEYRIKSKEFYSLNKIIISVSFLCCLTFLAVLVNLRESEEKEKYGEYGLKPFQFRIHQPNDNFATIFNCQDYCNTSRCPCKHMNITSSKSFALCTEICEQKDLENYSMQKKKYCRALKSSQTHFNIMFTIVATIAVLSLLDAALLLSSKSSWSPSYRLIFQMKPEKDQGQTEMIEMGTVANNREGAIFEEKTFVDNNISRQRGNAPLLM